MDPDRVYDYHHHRNLARHLVLQMALPGRLHLVRRVALRAQSRLCPLPRDRLDPVIRSRDHLDCVLFVLHGTGYADHFSCMHSAVHDAAASLSDLHGRDDCESIRFQTSPGAGPVPDSVHDRDDLALHIHFAPKTKTTQRGEYQFARRHA